MLTIFVVLLTLLTVMAGGITTVPFSIGLLAVTAVIFRKPWVFFLALGLGLFLDLITLRTLGYTGLLLTIFVFLVFLYERKFETGTAAFVFISTFLGGIIYLWIFEYPMIVLQALVNSLFAVLVFKILWSRLVLRSQIS